MVSSVLDALIATEERGYEDRLDRYPLSEQDGLLGGLDVRQQGRADDNRREVSAANRSVEVNQ